VIDWLKDRGWYDNTDIIFTTDHGEFQGDYGLLFKGPYHVDTLMRLPMIWQPAASTQTPAAIARRWTSGAKMSLPSGTQNMQVRPCI